MQGDTGAVERPGNRNADRSEFPVRRPQAVPGRGRGRTSLPPPPSPSASHTGRSARPKGY